MSDRNEKRGIEAGGADWLATTLVAVGLLGLLALPGCVALMETSEEPALRVGDASVAAGSNATVDVVLTTAPNGLAGYEIDVAVADGDVASVANATFPDALDPNQFEASDGGANASVQATDLPDEVQEGDADVLLVTITVAGVSPGETRIDVSPGQFDDDEGAPFEPAGDAGWFNVTG